MFRTVIFVLVVYRKSTAKLLGQDLAAFSLHFTNTEGMKLPKTEALYFFLLLFFFCVVVNITLIQKDLALCSLGDDSWLCNRAGVQINKVNYDDKVTVPDNH